MNLEEIKQRESKATKGEWKAKGENNPYISEVEVENGGEKELIVGSQKHSDIEFIAHARQDIPDLIEEVERLEKKVLTDFFEFGELSMHCENLTDENKRLREALEFYADREQYVEKMEANKGLCMYRPIMRDRGKTARQTLVGDSNE